MPANTTVRIRTVLTTVKDIPPPYRVEFTEEEIGYLSEFIDLFGPLDFSITDGVPDAPPTHSIFFFGTKRPVSVRVSNKATGEVIFLGPGVAQPTMREAVESLFTWMAFCADQNIVEPRSGGGIYGPSTPSHEARAMVVGRTPASWLVLVSYFTKNYGALLGPKNTP